MSFEPELPKDSRFIREMLLKKINIQLAEKYEKYVYSGEILFATAQIDIHKFTSTSKIEGKEIFYTITIKPTKAEVDLSSIKDQNVNPAIKTFIEIVVKSILRSNQLLKIGKAGYFFKEQSTYIKDLSK